MTASIVTKNTRLIDLTGQTFERLTVISRAENSKGGGARWKCECSCGKEMVTQGSGLRSGRTRSCGCLRREVAAERRRAARGSAFIAGVGVNDADYDIHKCPYYSTWRGVIDRCYNNKELAKRPTYAQCTVDPDWHYFSVFKEWMEAQEWEGKEIDKDIIEPGNQVYSADTCCFVTQKVNSLLIDQKGRRGAYPRGVGRKGKGFVAICRISGKSKHLGTFDTPEEAEKAYRHFKGVLLISEAIKQKDPRINVGLWKHAGKQLEVFK